MKHVTQNGTNGQDLVALAAEVRALLTLNGELARKLDALGRAEAIPVDTWLAKTTPGQLLDAWIAVRGPKSEAFLLDRIYRRRAARRAAL
jgi:hypothetical protein